jgi:transposase
MIADRLEPYRKYIDLLLTRAGIDWVTAVTVIAEVGIDLSAFPAVDHFAAWMGVCPGNNESAGKKSRSAPARATPISSPLCATPPPPRHAHPRASSSMQPITASSTASGGGRATLAVAHKIATAIY